MRKGLYANIHAKRKRGGKMKKKGDKGAPTAANFRRAAMTVKKKYWLNHPHGNVKKVRILKVDLIKKAAILTIVQLVVI